MLLTTSNLEVAYGPVCAARDISLSVREGEIVALIGANGAGKSSILRAISGIVHPVAGKITLNGQDITSLPPHRRTEKGLCLLPEGGGVFRDMSVDDNLRLAALKCSSREEDKRRLVVYHHLPKLQERLHQVAGTLSGGERQQLAIGRALMMAPQILLLDEPFLGLAPRIAMEVSDLIQQINVKQGTTILLVEQDRSRALKLASRTYFVKLGKIHHERSAADLVLFRGTEPEA